MLGAAGVIAQFVAGKAARDALFLARFDVTDLPLMVMAASVFSIACALLMSRAMSRVSPVRLLPLAFVASAVLVVLEWMLGRTSPGRAPSSSISTCSGWPRCSSRGSGRC